MSFDRAEPAIPITDDEIEAFLAHMRAVIAKEFP